MVYRECQVYIYVLQTNSDLLYTVLCLEAQSQGISPSCNRMRSSLYPPKGHSFEERYRSYIVRGVLFLVLPQHLLIVCKPYVGHRFSLRLTIELTFICRGTRCRNCHIVRVTRNDTYVDQDGLRCAPVQTSRSKCSWLACGEEPGQGHVVRRYDFFVIPGTHYGCTEYITVRCAHVRVSDVEGYACWPSLSRPQRHSHCEYLR